MRDAHVVIVDGDDAHAQRVRAALGGVGAEIGAAAALADGAAQLEAQGARGEARLLVVNYDALTPAERGGIPSFVSASATPVLLVSAMRARDDYGRLFVARALRNLVAAGPEPAFGVELATTANKLLFGDVFGLDKYFARADEERFSLSRASERRGVADRVDAWLRGRGVTARHAELFSTVLDELVTNAIYNAPVDGGGRRRNAEIPRDAEAVLGAGEEVVVRIAVDGRRVGISTEDPFGSMSEALVLDYFAKCFRKDVDQVDEKQGGAGLGLYYAFDAVSQLVVNLAPGRRTQVIGIMDLEPRFAGRGKSFNIFTERA